MDPAFSLPDVTRAMARGDESAWTTFHQHYYSFVLQAAKRLTRDQANAQDITQLSLLRMVRHMKTFDTANDLENWIRCLVRCVYVDSVRKSVRRSLLSEKFAHWQEMRRPDPLASALQNNLISELLSSLSPDDRQLVTSYYLDQKSQHDIAHTLGTTRKAIESRLSRIRQSLRLHQPS